MSKFWADAEFEVLIFQRDFYFASTAVFVQSTQRFMFKSNKFFCFSIPRFSTKSEPVKEVRVSQLCAPTPLGIGILKHKHVVWLLKDRRLCNGSYTWPKS